MYSDPYPVQFGGGDWITVVTNAAGTFTGEMGSACYRSSAVTKGRLAMGQEP